MGRTPLRRASEEFIETGVARGVWVRGFTHIDIVFFTNQLIKRVVRFPPWRLAMNPAKLSINA